MNETQPIPGMEPPADAPGAGDAGPPELTDAAAPAPTQPVTPSRPARPRGLIRWGVALGVLAVMIGVVSVGAVMLATGGKASSVQGWLPPGTLAYLELRADLPGDQRQNLSELLARFPGFKDQAALDQKLDTLFDDLFRKAEVSYSGEIKPWLQGEVAIVVTEAALPSTAALGELTDPAAAAAAMPDDGVALLAATTDPAKAEAWVAGEMKRSRARTETYAGVELKVVDANGRSIAWTVKEKILFAGTEGTVKAALDTGGTSPVAASQGFKDARATASGDYLGFAYVDLKAIVDWEVAALAAMPSTSGLKPECLVGSMENVPGWFAGLVRVEPDALVGDLAAPAVAGLYEPKNAVSEAARHLPASTLFYTGGRQAGDALVGLWSEVKKQLPCLGVPAGTADQLDQALAIVGGIDGLVGWAEDFGIAVSRDGSTWGGGLVLTSDDAAAPRRTADQLGTLLLLAGSQGNQGLDVDKETYGDGTLYTITTGSAPSVLTLAFTGQRGVFAAGTIDFVKAVVDTTEATSLAGADRYEATIERAGGDGTGEMYLDIAGLRDGIVALLPAEAKAQYEANVAPYLAPFDTAAMVAKAGQPNDTVRFIVTVK